MGAALRFRNDSVDTSQFFQVRCRDAHGLSCKLLLSRIAPHDGRTTFGRDHRVDRVLHHQHSICDSDSERPSTSAFPRNRGDNRNSQTHHLAEIAGDGFGLAPFLCPKARVRTRCVYKGEYSSTKLFRDLHRAQSFTVPFWIGHAKIAVNLLLGIARFLVPNDHNFFAMIPSHTANQCWIISKSAISMDLAPVCEKALNVVERIRTLRMPG